MKALMEEIERVLPEGGAWCPLDKAQTLASLIVGLRPAVVVEIGVWQGGSAIPMLLAMKRVGWGHMTAIDPWDAPSSAADQTPENAQWWQQVDHQAAYQKFLDRLARHELYPRCSVVRARSDDAGVPAHIDLLHVDGNHADQAVRDVARFAPDVQAGGILVLDDIGWTGGHVCKARDLAVRLGFAELYPLGTGIVMQRRRAP